MELVFVVAVLILFGILANLFGYDSRSVPLSKEHEFARLGVVWEFRDDHLDDLRREAALWRLAGAASRPNQGLRVRRRLALGLRAVAHWLSPELERNALPHRADAALVMTLRPPRAG
jgi:hypothetical protein